MQYNISPKKTKYNGRLYRSRLEAKWQSMFDKMGWKAEYEPSEINGYNPDFIIKCNSPYYATQHIIVEIKPSILTTKEYTDSVLKKYEQSKCHILVLTDFPLYSSNSGYVNSLAIGLGAQYYGDGEMFMEDMLMKDGIDISSGAMGWDGMIYGDGDRKGFIQNGSMSSTLLKLWWVESANDVMFHIKKYGNG